MASAGTYSLRQITRQSYCRSKALRQVFSEVEAQPSRRIKPTTTYFSAVAVLELTGRGRRFVDAIEEDGNATKIAWSVH